MKTAFKLRHTVLGVLLLGSAIALSATPKGPRVDVQYQDLDLSQPQNVEVLYSRITKAARRVCQTPGGNAAAKLHEYTLCFNSAVDTAVQSVNSERLTALHQAHTQKTRVS
jgi:UrcA family protein